MCPTCSNTPVSISSSLFNADCNCTPQGSELDSSCILYNGANLSCSSIITSDSIQVAIQKLDSKVCAVLGDYSLYNTACIAAGLNTEKKFVEGISSYVCGLNTTVNTFTGTTFPTYQTAVDTRFLTLEKPNVTGCSTYLQFLSTDSLQTVLNKISAKICSIHNTELSLANVVWDNCIVSAVPTTIAGAFQLVENQICSIQGGGGNATLPLFNNIGSCLASPGASDSLVETVNKIKTRVCQSPILNNAGLTSSCVTIPGTSTDLNGVLQNILTKVDSLSKAIPTFNSSDFTVVQTDGSNVCSGKTVSLGTPINQDKYVSATSADSAPGTLQTKLQAGTGITFDYSTTPGKVIINSASGDNFTVKANTADSAPSFLDNKIEAGDAVNGVGLGVVYNSGSQKVQVYPTLDLAALTAAILEAIQNSEDFRNTLCTILSSCPSPCSAPTSIQAIAV